MNYKDCTTKTKDPNILVRERKSRFRILNPSNKNIEKVKVDGCLITGNQEKRCDWLFALPADQRVLYVELKGSDIEKAAEQLEATVRATSTKYSCLVKNVMLLVLEFQTVALHLQRRKKNLGKNCN
jgi:hypothetical protein